MRFELEKFTIINEEDNLQIDINSDIEIPENLYKYYSLTNNSLNVLKNNTIHFSHSFTMNDLMDGSFLLWEMEKFVIDIMIRHDFPIDKKIPHQQAIIRYFSDEFLKNIGVFCLCENYKNDLLWSHYTNEKGFCIEIDRKELIESLKNYQTLFFPINYGELTQINLLDNCIKKYSPGKIHFNANIPILYSLANKETFWSYEKEWRLIIRDESFDKVTNPQVLISQEQKKIEQENLKKRNIKIPESVFRKIIFSTAFFNNSRFESSEFEGMKVKYFFYDGEEKNILIDFFKILKEKYIEKIFQVDKYLKDGKVLRDIIYQVKILEINDKYVEIIRKNFC